MDKGQKKIRAQHGWNKVKQRLLGIIASELDVSFINSPVHKRTGYSEIKLRFFQVKLNGDIIWRFPKDSEQNKDYFLYSYCPCNGKWRIEYPIRSIITYLDLPKEQLIEYEDKAGLADILKVCDKRIGYNRLKTLELSTAAKKVFDARFKDKKESTNN
jgi:hypothetical protein